MGSTNGQLFYTSGEEVKINPWFLYLCVHVRYGVVWCDDMVWYGLVLYGMYDACIYACVYACSMYACV